MTSKRQSLSIEVKKSVLEAVELGTTNHTELSRRFKIDRKSVRRILESKDAINNAVYDGRNSKRTKFRPPKQPPNKFRPPNDVLK